MRLRRTIRSKRSHRSEGINAQSDVHANLAVNVGERGGVTTSSSSQRIVQKQGGSRMAEKELVEEPRDEVSQEELEAQSGEELPDREAMSLINANVAAPVNAAVALNALSDNSEAIAIANQDAPINQTAG